MSRFWAGLAVLLLMSPALASPRLTCAQAHASGSVVSVGGDDRPLTGRYVRCGLVGVPAEARSAVLGLHAADRSWHADSPNPLTRGDTVEFWFTLYPSGDYPVCASETRVEAHAFDAAGAAVAAVEQSWRQACPPKRVRGAAWDDDALSMAPRSSRDLIDRVASAVVEGDIDALIDLVPEDGLRLGKRHVSAVEARRILTAAGVSLTGIAPTCPDDDEPGRCRWTPWTIQRVDGGLVWVSPRVARTEAPIRCLVFAKGEGGWRWAGIDHLTSTSPR